MGEIYGYGSRASALKHDAFGSHDGYTTYYNPAANSAIPGAQATAWLMPPAVQEIHNVVINNAHFSGDTYGVLTPKDISTLSLGFWASAIISGKFKIIVLGISWHDAARTHRVP